jgi:hypothetical protein
MTFTRQNLFKKAKIFLKGRTFFLTTYLTTQATRPAAGMTQMTPTT